MNRKSAREILSDLVAFPVLGGESNLEIIAYIQSHLEQFGIQSTLVENKAEKKASLHCRIGPAVDGGVILSGHTDVVPVEGQDWETNPFQLVEKEGKLYARGSCDMKGFLACCLAALPDLVAANLSVPIYFAFSYDEEIGCLAGTELAEAIRDYYTEKPKYAIIGEPSMMQPIVGQKGIYIQKVTVHGSAGHSSRIKQEVSAVHEAARLIMWLEQEMERLSAKNIDERFHPNHTSIHVGMVNGGIAPNVIADTCTFTVDYRTIPSDNLHLITTKFEAYCADLELRLRERFEGAKIVVEEHHPPVPPLDTKEDAEVVAFIRALSGVYELDAVSYAAEAGQFALAGFESVICGPGSIAQAHRANEFISIEQLEKGESFIKKLIQKLSVVESVHA